MNIFFAWLAGLLFGFGLLISGMSDPKKVISFLDITGLWDPSLVFVMIGGISITAIGFWIASKRSHTLLGAILNLPTNKRIDRSLLIGASLFGIGWGIAGICPGPAIVLMGGGVLKGIHICDRDACRYGLI